MKLCRACPHQETLERFDFREKAAVITGAAAPVGSGLPHAPFDQRPIG